ncbi:MAG: RNA methyltransferase [Oscillospiraceae bacterium]|nr:RNA methyltransferase [Oscillospiraceae bacterium]
MAGTKFIYGRNNAFITGLCKLKQKKHRDQTGLFYFEGLKLLQEALNSRYRGKIKHIIAEENTAGRISAADFEMTVVTSEVYKKITDEEGFEGVMCIMEKPEQSGLSYKKPVVILCSVRDPGNVGAIIRTAEAVCGADIIVSCESADIYSAKTQRAAMGAIFRQNIKISENIGEDIANLKKNGYNVFAAHLDEDSRPIDEIPLGAKTAVAFGNEGRGLEAGITKLCDQKLIIPINKKSESLNVSVAAGIVLWEIGKQQKKGAM